MALSVSVSFGNLPNPFSWAEVNAFVRSITVSISGSIGGSDIASGAITDTHVTPDAYWYGDATLSGGVYTLTLAPALTGYGNGVVVSFKADVVNTGAVDINVNGLGQKNLLKLNAQECEAGDIPAGHIVTARYDGTQFRILSVTALPDVYRAGTAAGTANALTLTLEPQATLTLALLAGRPIVFEAAAANTDEATLQINALTAKAIRKWNNTALDPGDIAGAGQYAVAVYDASNDVFILAGGAKERDTAVVAASRNLVITNNSGSAATSIDIDADEIVLKSSTQSMVASSVNLTVAITSSGANGLDTGTEAGDTVYYLWVIYNPATGTTAGLLSTSATSPTLPSGYTFKALVGAVRNDSASDFDTIYQRDRRVWIEGVKAMNDTTGQTSYTSLSLAAIVPPIARSVYGVGGATSANNVSMAVAGNDAGLGETLCHGNNVAALSAGAAGLEEFTCGGGFHVPMATPQTIYWMTHTTTANAFGIVISGYTI